MDTLVFLGLWGLALIFRSRAALAVALFQHAYIRVPWYCTKQPDGVVLYRRRRRSDGAGSAAREPASLAAI